MLIERDIEPYEGVWAIPGGFVRPGETLIAAATRELEEETGIAGVFLEQLYTFGDPDRDPRGWVVSVAYYALVSPEKHQDRKSTRLNSSHSQISYAVFCLKKKKK